MPLSYNVHRGSSISALLTPCEDPIAKTLHEMLQRGLMTYSCGPLEVEASRNNTPGVLWQDANERYDARGNTCPSIRIGKHRILVGWGP